MFNCTPLQQRYAIFVLRHAHGMQINSLSVLKQRLYRAAKGIFGKIGRFVAVDLQRSQKI